MLKASWAASLLRLVSAHSKTLRLERVREKGVRLSGFVSLQPNCMEMFWEHTAAVTHGTGPYLKADRNDCLTNPRISMWLQEDVFFLTPTDKPLQFIHPQQPSVSIRIICTQGQVGP